MANLSEEFSYIISAKDVTSAAIASAKSGLQSLKSASADVSAQMERHWVSFKSQWLGVTAAVTAAAIGIREAWGMMRAAADYVEQMQLLDALARKYNTTSAAIVAAIASAGEGMIGMAKAAEVAAAGLAKGITPKQLTDLAGAAATLADFMGVRVEDAFQQFTQALETGRTRAITAAVGITEMTNATEEMTAKMTPAMKAQQAYNAIMEATAKVKAQLGDATETAADKMEKFEVQIKNIRLELGIHLLRAAMLTTSAFQYLAAGVLGLVAANERLWGQKENAAAAWQARNALVKDAANNYRLAASTTAELTTATARNAAASERAKTAIQAQEAAAKDAIKALQALAQAQAKVGEEQLRLAQSGYNEALKAESATIAQMRASLGGYLSTLSSVYATRIDGETMIANMMMTSKASAGDQAKQQAEILKSELAFIKDKLAAWKTYYDALAAQHKAATDKMKSLTAELAAMEKAQRDQQTGHAGTMLELQTKLAQAKGKAATDESIYLMKLQSIEAERAAASNLSGAEQIAALEKVKQQYASLTTEVTTESKVWDTTQSKWIEKNEVIITSQKAIEQAIRNVASVQEEIALAQQKAIDAKKAEIETVELSRAKLAAAMTEAKQMMSEYEAKIVQVSNELFKLDKEIAITVNDQASGPIAQIAAALNNLPSVKYIDIVIRESGSASGASAPPPSAVPSGTALGSSPGYTGTLDLTGLSTITETPWAEYAYGNSGGGTVSPASWGGDAPAGDGSYAFGTRYVPHTGLFRLHEGEAVIPKREVQTIGQTIHFAPTISIAGGGKSAEQIAREIVRPLQAEMRRLGALA